MPAIVTRVNRDSIDILTADQVELQISWKGLQWARPYIDADRRGPPPKTASEIVGVGDIIRYEAMQDGTLALGQHPKIQGALIALDPYDGAIRALVGGISF